jgi:monoamine oxidase
VGPISEFGIDAFLFSPSPSSTTTRRRPNMVSQKVFDTVILGAGWSGAVAARDLTAKGYSVLILEGRDRVGGRAQTWRDKGKGDVKIDVGCSWIHGYTEGNPTREIAKGLGVVGRAIYHVR